MILQLLQQKVKEEMERSGTMTRAQKRAVILIVIILAAAVLGRMTVQAVLNLLLGGTLFGGNFL
jgi:hypothetical protein